MNLGPHYPCCGLLVESKDRLLHNWSQNKVSPIPKMSRVIGIVAYNLTQAFWLIRRFPKVNFLIIYPDEVFDHPVQGLIITSDCPQSEPRFRFRNLPTLILGSSVGVYRQSFNLNKIVPCNNYCLYGNYWLIEEAEKSMQGIIKFVSELK